MRLRLCRPAWHQDRESCISFSSDHIYFSHFYDPVDINIDGKIVTTERDAMAFFHGNDPNFQVLAKLGDCYDILAIEIDDAQSVFDKFDIKLNQIYYINNYGFITDILLVLQNEGFSLLPHNEIMSDLKIKELLILFSRKIHKYSYKYISRNSGITVHRVRNMMFDDLTKNWTLDELAEYANLSPDSFRKMYKNVYGVPPIKDLQLHKIEVAKQMLCQEEILISDIAQKLGYCDVFHFIKQFKKIVGITPKQYAKTGSVRFKS